MFANGLSPSFMARESDEAKFKELLEKADKERSFYVQFS